MVCLLLTTGQYEQFFVHFVGLSELGVRFPGVRGPETIVSVSVSTFGVSSINVFTIRVHPTIMLGCRQTNTYERPLANESETYAAAKASAKKRSLTNAALSAPICLALRLAQQTPVLRLPRCSLTG
ncbi:hypothetical protein PSEEN1777 [Pseudomonas entomophila L48]|uniref:Uncharacterized protein n=1 Tax=Pseudomonas entomophila (strain L48) TaxID=384676 RepID=Q1ICJ3_PSEE4|nr:hypothetical protein PSEEN1777 [Pseudomonas entomophila L48]